MPNKPGALFLDPKDTPLPDKLQSKLHLPRSRLLWVLPVPGSICVFHSGGGEDLRGRSF
jgi:hypothetical protein